MKTLYKLAVLAVVVMCLSSCEITRYYRRTSFVTLWYEVDAIGVHGRENMTVQGEECIYLSIGNERTTPLASLMGLENNDKKKYQYYCSQHGDVSYRSKSGFNKIPNIFNEWMYSFPADDFVSIRLVAVSDWDNAHPSGSDLGDLSWYAGLTVKPYIDSGYKDCDYSQLRLSPYFRAVWGDDMGEFNRYYYPVDKAIVDLTSDDLSLCGFGFDMSLFDFFVKAPSQPATLRLTATTLSGKVLQTDVNCEPDK